MPGSASSFIPSYTESPSLKNRFAFPRYTFRRTSYSRASDIPGPVLGRPDDIIASGIATAVVVVVAAISLWKQPILRVLDTMVGVAAGVVGASISLKSGPRRSTAT
jgi:hypothetical protein